MARNDIAQNLEDNKNNWLNLKNAIEDKGISTTGMTCSDMVDVIDNMQIAKLTTLNVTPTSSSQHITPTGEFNGFSEVNVSAVALEEKTVTPSVSQQVITPSQGKYGISQVTVEAVDSSIDSDIQPQNIKSGVNILGVDGTMVGSESDVINIESLADFTSIDATRCACDYNGKLEFFLDSKHYEYDIDNNTWSTIASISIIGYNYRNGANGVFNTGYLVGNKVTFLKLIATGSGYNYVTIREYDMTSHTAADRAGGSGSVTANYPCAYTLHDGYIYASCKINGVFVIIKVNLNTLTYTVVVTNTAKYYKQIEFVGDTLYGINSGNGLDLIDITNNTVSTILTLAGDERNLVATSENLYVMGNDSGYKNIYKLENGALSLYYSSNIYMRDALYYIYKGDLYQFGGRINYINYGTNTFRKLGSKFKKELSVGLTSGLEIDTKYITKVTLI